MNMHGAGPLVLGTNTFGWTSDGEESFAVLDAFAEAGGTMSFFGLASDQVTACKAQRARPPAVDRDV
ncbi:hypothetical protein ABT300_39800 [Streptomyces sp. NPDC001027]|uniref:hypothetical protein n=1 Tax=Streptomyces sp. NPDC001027 TaxID=3154771 RepID=UPI00333372BF